MTTINTSCPLDLTPTTISAWRDGALSADESARIAAHVPGCPACQRETARAESLDDALRRLPVPASDGSLWRSVRAGMSGGRRQPPARRQRVRRMVGAGSALAAVLLLALGFAQLFRVQGAMTGAHPTTTTTTTAQGTPTPLPTAIPALPAVSGAHPAWKPANLPIAGIAFGDQSSGVISFAIAPTDGQIAYACFSTTDSDGSQIWIYRTATSGRDWTLLTRIPASHLQTSACTPQVDALDANRVLVSILGNDMRINQTVGWHELTEDSGATWTKLSYADGIYGIATVKGNTYAIRLQMMGKDPTTGQPRYVQHLVVSHDHLRTWRVIDTPLTDPVQKQGAWRFWARPDGELLAQAMTTVVSGNSKTSGRALWLSDDGGAHWRPFPMPTLTSGLNTGADDMFITPWTVQQPLTPQQSWHVCIHEMINGSNVTTAIVCTEDSGKDWNVRPYLCENAPCATDRAGSFGVSDETLAADGSLLLIAPNTSTQLGLYRLPTHSSQWEYLGPVPGGNTFFYAPTARGGILWFFAGGVVTQANLSGHFGGKQAVAATLSLSTATYP